jgi:putative addiction module component (TIGR02574 family)
MTTRTRQVLRKALALPPKARADIAGTLLRSLDVDDDDTDVEDAWAAEVERRFKDVESGKVKLIPWDTVRRRLRATLKRANAKT